MKVRDLIQILKKVDPSLNVEMTMNREYQSPIGAIFVSPKNKLIIDDVPIEEDWIPIDLRDSYNVLYSEFEE